jgi:hypothetical protein
MPGAFIRSKYQASAENGGGIHPIRVQPETEALAIGSQANSPPAGAVTSPFSAEVSSGRRSLGLHARKLYFRFPTTTPNGYKPDAILSLPLLNEEIAALAIAGATGTYLGQSILVVGKSPEQLK